MATNKPRVIVTRKLPDMIETRMMELFDTQLNLDDVPMDAETLGKAMETADILVPTVTDHIDQRVLARAGENLRLIASFGTGVDHIDVATARSRGITVTNTPGVLTEDTADMTMALILAVPRRLIEGVKLLESGDWAGWSPTHMLGNRIYGKRLGIIGMGRIGTAVARRARPSACRSIITTVTGSMKAWNRNWRRPIGKASTRCWPGWISYRSTVRTPRRPITCCRPAG